MTRITIVAILLALPGLAAAQQPDHIAFHGLASFYTEDADPHLGAGVSWHKHVGRNWGLNVEYDFTSTAATASRQRAHSDHVLWLGVMKSFGPPDRSVPYIVIGAAGFYRHTLVPGAAGATGFGPTLGVGVGRRHWNKSRRWFIAPEARLLINAHLTASVALGFRL